MQPGVEDPYEWCLKHWGTMWVPFYSKRVADDAISFVTGINHPYPIIEAISRKFPDLTIEVMFGEDRDGEDDLGPDAERYTIKGGQRLTNSPADSTLPYK